MFNTLASYLLGYSQDATPAQASERDLDVRLTAVPADDDEEGWLLVEAGTTAAGDDRDSEGDTDVHSSLESIPDMCRMLLPYEPALQPLTLRITRSSSTSSLPNTGIEESWFITPPPCFTSAGPINMETSPLENLLIEHPSMSVYQHGPSLATAVIARRRNSAPSVASNDEMDDRQIDVIAEEQEEIEPRVMVGRRQRRGAVETMRQQERQCVKIKNAQKLQIHKACQSLKRNYFERNNKAREVNCRNHRQRRGERSQGMVRSNANNNRKC